MSFNHPAYYKRALGILKSLNERTKGRNDEYKYHLAICYLNTNIDKKKAAELLSTIEKGEKEDHFLRLSKGMCVYVPKNTSHVFLATTDCE